MIFGEDENAFRLRMQMLQGNPFGADPTPVRPFQIPADIRAQLSPPEPEFSFPSLDNPQTAGIDIIGEMDRQNMIQELIHHQLVLLNDMSDFDLKRHIIHMRMGAYQKRLVEEARLEEDQPPPMGFLQFVRRDDD